MEAKENTREEIIRAYVEEFGLDRVRVVYPSCCDGEYEEVKYRYPGLDITLRSNQYFQIEVNGFSANYVREVR